MNMILPKEITDKQILEQIAENLQICIDFTFMVATANNRKGQVIMNQGLVTRSKGSMTNRQERAYNESMMARDLMMQAREHIKNLTMLYR
jgi:hypothetical protein